MTLRLGPILEDKAPAVVLAAYSNLQQEEQEGICGGSKHVLLYSCTLFTETHTFTPRLCQHNEKRRRRWLCVVLPPSTPHRKHEGERQRRGVLQEYPPEDTKAQGTVLKASPRGHPAAVQPPQITWSGLGSVDISPHVPWEHIPQVTRTLPGFRAVQTRTLLLFARCHRGNSPVWVKGP